MPPENPGTQTTTEAVSEAVERLQAFEFTEYEAKCFVGLARISRGTAKDVSQVADVPRARVYDCMETLQARGLVDVQQSTPREFRAVAPDEAVFALESRYRTHLDRLETLLEGLEPPESTGTTGDVWVMEGESDVSERMQKLLAGASEEVLLAIAVDDLVTDGVLGALQQAAENGAAITVGSPGADIRETIAARVLTANVAETWTWWETYPVKPGAISAILMVDGRALLVSAGFETGETTRQRAVWTDSADAPLVGMMRPLFASAIGGQ